MKWAKIQFARGLDCLFGQFIDCLFVCLVGCVFVLRGRLLDELVDLGRLLSRWRVPSNCCQAVTPGGPITNWVPQKRLASRFCWDSGGIIEELLVENNDVWSLKITLDVWASHVLSIASESRLRAFRTKKDHKETGHATFWTSPLSDGEAMRVFGRGLLAENGSFEKETKPRRDNCDNRASYGKLAFCREKSEFWENHWGIKFPIWGESNNTNLWHLWGISLLTMHCLGW